MTTEEKKQFALIAKLAIERLHVDSLHEIENDMYILLRDVPEFKAFCAAGLHEGLEECGFIGEVKDDAEVSMTVKQFYGSVVSAITIGMDLAVMMHRYGAKFPVPKQN